MGLVEKNKTNQEDYKYEPQQLWHSRTVKIALLPPQAIKGFDMTRSGYRTS